LNLLGEGSKQECHKGLIDLKYEATVKLLVSQSYVSVFDKSVLIEIKEICNSGWMDTKFATIVTLFSSFGLDESIIVRNYKENVDDYVEILWHKMESHHKKLAYYSIRGIDKPPKGIALSILYVITDEDRLLCNTHKIGYHTGSLSQLERRYKTSLIKYQLEYYIETPNHIVLEKRVHKKLQQYRRCGEWFACDIEMIKQTINSEMIEPVSSETLFRERYRGTLKIRGAIKRILDESRAEFKDISDNRKRKLLSMLF
jgi:hypothetical protein